MAPTNNENISSNNEKSIDAFTSHTTQLNVGDRKIQLRVLKMIGSTFVLLTDESECMDELAVAITMKAHNGKEQLATSIIGPQIASDSQHVAIKLSKRFERQFFVSYNVQIDRITAPILERTLYEYINNNKSQFV